MINVKLYTPTDSLEEFKELTWSLPFVPSKGDTIELVFSEGTRVFTVFNSTWTFRNDGTCDVKVVIFEEAD